MCYATINQPPPPSETLIDSDTLPDPSHSDFMKDYSQVGNTMVTMADMMQTFIDMAYRKFCQMSGQMDAARDTQKMTNQVNIIISQLGESGEVGVLPAEVTHYLRDNNILVDEQTIDQFLHDNARIGRCGQEGQFHLFIGISASALVAIKTALKSTESQASDIVRCSQQKLMQLMKDFNTALTMTHNVQSMNAATVKSIEHSIR
jgi:secreted effector protein SseB